MKSTRESTPVTWKRAKIPNSLDLIAQSRTSAEGLQALGDAIIDFCNRHAKESLRLYGLDRIGYCRVVLRRSEVLYFERELITREAPDLFDREQFTWSWSVQKRTRQKEQLSALHGFDRQTGGKWFAAHLLGENQLHFSGEAAWWPKPGDEVPVARFPYPEQGALIDFDALVSWLDSFAGG